MKFSARVWEARLRTKSPEVYTLGVIVALFGCSASEGDDTPIPIGSGGSINGSGGVSTGGSAWTGGVTGTGGNPSTGGISSTGGASPATGGSKSTGGTNTGGSNTGGKASTGGKSSTGGSSTGGKSSTGGTSSGGKSAMGGSATGGTSMGGKASTGGSATGGASSGGKAGTGGSSSTGGSTGCSGPALSGGTQHCSSNMSGTVAGYTYTIWSSGSGGCITPYGTGAAYKATWNNSGDFLARVGLQWNETQTHDQLGTISADYAFTKTGTAGGFSFIGIYGWSNTPLVEYYIVEDWFGGGSAPTGGGTLKGTFTVDGGSYNVYTHTQTNQPSIHGTQTFPQFFSVRQAPRQCGHISISEHFKQWASYGMTLGKMYEAKLLIEAGGGSGSIDFTSASITAKK
jgi:hypothetical protein